MKPSKPKPVWVSRDCRDKYTYTDMVNFHHNEPQLLNERWRDYYEYMYYESFKEMFGISIRPGQCLKVSFQAKVIK